MTTEIRCPTKECEYNQKGICRKKVLTMIKEHSWVYTVRCSDIKIKS